MAPTSSRHTSTSHRLPLLSHRYPDHPHLGVETLTYLFTGCKGNWVYEDTEGRSVQMKGGEAQWLVSGPGMTHCEIVAAKQDDY